MIRTIPLLVLAMLAFIPRHASAQVDRARGEVYADFTSTYNVAVQSARNENRDAAIRALLENSQKLTGMLQVTGDAPSKLNDADLRELASDAQRFIESMGKYRDRSNSLMEKLKRGGEDYRSELSSLEESYSELKERFNGLWGNLIQEGQALARKSKGLKAVCDRACGL